MIKLKDAALIFGLHLLALVLVTNFGDANMNSLLSYTILLLTFIFVTLPLFIISIIWYFAKG